VTKHDHEALTPEAEDNMEEELDEAEKAELERILQLELEIAEMHKEEEKRASLAREAVSGCNMNTVYENRLQVLVGQLYTSASKVSWNQK